MYQHSSRDVAAQCAVRKLSQSTDAYAVAATKLVLANVKQQAVETTGSDTKDEMQDVGAGKCVVLSSNPTVLRRQFAQ